MSVRILGIDFGEKRVGVAFAEGESGPCVPLVTLDRRSDLQVIEDLLGLVAEHVVTELVVGEPRNVDGTRGPAARRARSFARKLARRAELEVTLIDEALSTVEATERLRDAGLSGAALRQRVDAVAAQVLLEDALERRGAMESSP